MREERLKIEKVVSTIIPTLCALILLTLVACGGKKEVKQASQENRIAEEAFAVAETLKTAYVRKNFPAIQEISTANGYRDVINAVKHFDSAELTFTPKWVEIEKSVVYLNVAWKGSWTVGGEIFRERGMAVFQLEGKPLRLARIVRGNPFQYPEK